MARIAASTAFGPRGTNTLLTVSHVRPLVVRALAYNVAFWVSLSAASIGVLVSRCHAGQTAKPPFAPVEAG